MTEKIYNNKYWIWEKVYFLNPYNLVEWIVLEITTVFWFEWCYYKVYVNDNNIHKIEWWYVYLIEPHLFKNKKECKNFLQKIKLKNNKNLWKKELKN